MKQDIKMFLECLILRREHTWMHKYFVKGLQFLGLPMLPEAAFVQTAHTKIPLVAFHHETQMQISFGDERSTQLALVATRRVEFGNCRVGQSLAVPLGASCERRVAVKKALDGKVHCVIPGLVALSFGYIVGRFDRTWFGGRSLLPGAAGAG
jgi:hypothetical protein